MTYRKKNFLGALCLAGAAFVPHSAAAQSSTGVAATVNEYVISNYDLDQRVALYSATSGVRLSDENRQQIRAQVLRALEDETIELQEANKRKISVSKAEIDKALQNIAEDNKLTFAQLIAAITQAGVAPMTFVNQIGAQIIWQKLVASRYGADIQVTDQQVDQAMERLKLGADKPQFLLSEIYIAADKPENENAARASAEQIARTIAQGAVFPAVANQFSQLPSAADGGDIGWVVQGQLADELDQALLSLRPGQIAGPIRAEGGYYVLLLRDRREPASRQTAAAPASAPPDPNAPVALDRFLIPLPADPDAMLKARAMSLAADAKNQIRSCADLPGIANRLPGSVYQRLGEMNPKDLTPELREALAKTGPGEAASPFFSSAGLELIVRCDAGPKPYGIIELPTRDQLQQQLFAQQMSLYAKSYLRDLRRSAVVYGTGGR